MKKSVWRFNVFLFCIILGILLILQFKNVKGQYEYVPIKDIDDYKLSIDSEKKKIEQLKEIIEVKKDKIQAFKKIKIEGGKFKEVMAKELKDQKMVSGFVDLEGPGVILTVDDATRRLEDGEDPNLVLVHDIDILNLLNDLRVAGAEAISINGQRLVENSEISCAGHTIRINDQFFAQPFIIKAVGDPKKLEAALLAPGSYAQLIKDYYGLYVEVDTSLNIKIPKYSEEIDLKYLKVAKEGE